MDKSPDAFRTITEVADWLDTPAHVLRFWESRFSQIKPVKRAGGRRYYRPLDMLLLGGIKKLLHDDGITIKGVQKTLREQGIKHVQSLSQPVSLQVSVKKKSSRDVAPPVLAPEIHPSVEATIEPSAQHVPVEEERVSSVVPEEEIVNAVTPEPPEKEAVDPMAERVEVNAPPPVEAQDIPKMVEEEDHEVDDDIEELQTASPEEPDISVIKLPEILKTTSEIPHKDMQEIEALYYSLKMVRNNMKRTGAGR